MKGLSWGQPDWETRDRALEAGRVAAEERLTPWHRDEAWAILMDTYGQVLRAFAKLGPDAPNTQETMQLRADAAYVQAELARLGVI